MSPCEQICGAVINLLMKSAVPEHIVKLSINKKISYLLNLSIFYQVSPEPISCHWPLLIPPENIRKPDVFGCFQGVTKDIDMKWVENVQ